MPDTLEVRIAHLEGAYEQIDRRLGSLERKVDEMRSELLARMDRQFFWILGLLLVSILLPIAVRLTGH